MDLIIGANGNIGREVVQFYISEGRSFRAAVRTVAKWENHQNSHGEVAYFDFENQTTYNKVLNGIESVFLRAYPVS